MRIAALLVAPILLVASVALADEAPSSATSPAPKNATPPVPKAPELEPKDPATSPGVANATADLKRIRERASQVDPKEQEATEKSLRETAAGVDAATAKKEKAEIAGRLAAEFGGIPELYLGEHDRLKQSWGEIAIAHTLLADAKTSLTVDQLFDLRQEKLGWGQIAHGLDLSPSEFSKSAQARARSASGAGAAGKGATVEAKADAVPPSATPSGASTKAKSNK